jgi:hypothetical protein
MSDLLLKELQQEVAALKVAIKAADSWIRGSEGVSLLYYSQDFVQFGDVDRDAYDLITKVLGE